MAKKVKRLSHASGRAAFAESNLVRSNNRIYAEYGIGRIRQIKKGIARVDYLPSVFMSPPYEWHQKLHPISELEKVDTPLDRAARGEWEQAWRFELKMLAARLLTANKGGQLSNARTEILPHQIFTAHRVVSSPRRRFLLADEVGLGKTIEAGMICQALHQRGQAKRTLIITPAGLTSQWQEEMQDKFGAHFEIFGRDFMAVNPRVWDYKAAAIASLTRLKRKEHKRILLENRKWDLIIFDEAHRLSAVNYGSGKVEKTQNYKLAEEIRLPEYSEAFLLLTATPHQGEANHSRFKNLVRLLDDDIDFSSLEEDFPLLQAGLGIGGIGDIAHCSGTCTSSSKSKGKSGASVTLSQMRYLPAHYIWSTSWLESHELVPVCTPANQILSFPRRHGDSAETMPIVRHRSPVRWRANYANEPPDGNSQGSASDNRYQMPFSAAINLSPQKSQSGQICPLETDCDLPNPASHSDTHTAKAVGGALGLDPCQGVPMCDMLPQPCRRGGAAD